MAKKKEPPVVNKQVKPKSKEKEVDAKLQEAEEVASAGRVMLAGGARNVAQGQETFKAAQVADVLSQAVGEAGVTDLLQGASMLAASDDIALQSALVSALSEEELGYGMDLAAIAGQLWTVSDVVAGLDMPVLADFLEIKGEELQNIAVEVLLRFGATHALAAYMEETGAEVESLGMEEAFEGAARLDISAGMDARSQELAQTGAALTAKGLSQLAAAGGMRDAAKDLVTDSLDPKPEQAEDQGEDKSE